MESVREAMYKAINKYGLSSNQALKASQELDKHIVEAQKQKLTKDKFMKKVINDKYKKKYEQKVADRYAAEKSRDGRSNAAMHTKRYPYHKSK